MLEKIQRTAQSIKALGSNGCKTYPLGTPFDFIRKDYEGASAPSVPAVEKKEPEAVKLEPKYRGGATWDAKNTATGAVIEVGLGSKSEMVAWIEAQEAK